MAKPKPANPLDPRSDPQELRKWEKVYPNLREPPPTIVLPSPDRRTYNPFKRVR